MLNSKAENICQLQALVIGKKKSLVALCIPFHVQFYANS